jgi:carbon monoxide dehydrogenase subunit G
MQFENEFSVSSPIDTVWSTLLDVEEVAPCMPGAEVLEQTGDRSYKVAIKVRLGPVSMQYRGDVEIVDADDQSHTARLVAKATEARGQGTANAEIHMQLADGDGSTHATLTTDLRLSGRAAAMGQGIVKDVASKLTETFADCLAAKLQGEPAAAGVAAGESGDGWSPTEGSTEVSERESAPVASQTTAASPVVRPPEEETAEGREVTTRLEREEVEAATEGFTTPDRADSLRTQPEVPSTPPEEKEEAKPPPPRPPRVSAPSPEVQAELPALEIAASVVADRLRKPSVLGGAVAAVFFAGFVVGRLLR